MVGSAPARWCLELTRQVLSYLFSDFHNFKPVFPSHVHLSFLNSCKILSLLFHHPLLLIVSLNPSLRCLAHPCVPDPATVRSWIICALGRAVRHIGIASSQSPHLLLSFHGHRELEVPALCSRSQTALECKLYP